MDQEELLDFSVGFIEECHRNGLSEEVSANLLVKAARAFEEHEKEFVKEAGLFNGLKNGIKGVGKWIGAPMRNAAKPVERAAEEFAHVPGHAPTINLDAVKPRPGTGAFPTPPTPAPFIPQGFRGPSPAASTAIRGGLVAGGLGGLGYAGYNQYQKMFAEPRMNVSLPGELLDPSLTGSGGSGSSGGSGGSSLSSVMPTLYGDGSAASNRYNNSSTPSSLSGGFKTKFTVSSADQKANLDSLDTNISSLKQRMDALNARAANDPLAYSEGKSLAAQLRKAQSERNDITGNIDDMKKTYQSREQDYDKRLDTARANAILDARDADTRVQGIMGKQRWLDENLPWQDSGVGRGLRWIADKGLGLGGQSLDRAVRFKHMADNQRAGIRSMEAAPENYYY